MYSLRKKIQYTLIKKDSSALCTLIALLHFVLAPICFYYEYDFLACYHIYATILYLVMVILSRAIPPLFLFTMSDIETISYCILLTVKLGNNVGSYLLPLTMLTYLYMLVISSRRSKYATVLPTFLTLLTIVSVLVSDYRNADAFQLIPKNFYLLHYIIYCVFSFFAIAFICYIISKKVARFKNKTRVKTAYLNYSATHDSLTKILNRRKLSDILNDYTRNQEYASTSFSTAIFDIDNFKIINDTYGHNCGDIILRNLADLVTRSLPEHTVFARWGGEEFIILFVGITGAAKSTLEELRMRVQEHSFRYANKPIKITITIGLSKADKSYNFSKMLIQADKNLIKGKQSGKNRVVCEEDL
ncbi:MAG: GGDEF domain-containing protein [Treponema sp.]|uniref:GGDEF domain-containing protein n=1 Tax=Treponema sp. TaxID=166 RepID=UPI00298D8A34|nr:GGDEF domain-containing protein [Treponema sp.]MBR5933001.1 GGDEF domain-containing protein [Treponema sp.]